MFCKQQKRGMDFPSIPFVTQNVTNSGWYQYKTECFCHWRTQDIPWRTWRIPSEIHEWCWERRKRGRVKMVFARESWRNWLTGLPLYHYHPPPTFFAPNTCYNSTTDGRSWYATLLTYSKKASSFCSTTTFFLHFYFGSLKVKSCWQDVLIKAILLFFGELFNLSWIVSSLTTSKC